MQVNSKSNNTVTLYVNGRKYENWLDVSITCALQTLARTFTVSATRDKEDLTLGVKPGDSVQVFIGEDRVLTGYITKREVSYNASGSSIRISGASKTVDLQDCCMPMEYPVSYKNQTNLQNLQSVCRAYDIKVVDQVGAVDRRNLEFTRTEKLGSAIQNYLRKNGLLLTDNEFGDLVIASAGSAGMCEDAIQLGVNVLEGSHSADYSKLYSEYVTLGQAANVLSELPVSSNQLKAEAKDPTGTRRRCLVQLESGNASSEILKKRVGVLQIVSSGESELLSYTVQGWRQINGNLWKVNCLVKVSDDLLDIDSKTAWVISEVSYSLSRSGTTCSLKLKKPFCYTLMKEPDAKKIKIEDEEIKKDSGRIP